MEEQDQEVALRNNQQQADYDYVDRLQPGYRFCPTDVEIIVHYLIPQIETGTHPPCRLHKVNIYDHAPEDLAKDYCPCDANWYFLTPRTRRYRNGKRPSRTVKEGVGHWHASQKGVPVYLDDPAVKKQVVVGRKTSFTYQQGPNDDKTPWLMQEYTTNDPDLPLDESGQDGTKLTQWVICKIYMKPSENKKQIIRGRVLNYAKNNDQDQAGGYDDQGVQINQQQQPLLPLDDDQPSSPKRQRLSSHHGVTSSDQQNEVADPHHQFHHEEANNNDNNLCLTTNNEQQQLNLVQQWLMSDSSNQPLIDDHVVQEYFHQDPTSILLHTTTTVDDQAPNYHHDLQHNIEQTINICPQPQITTGHVYERPLHQAFTTSDQPPIDVVVQEYFHQDPTYSTQHTTTVDDQPPYQQQNINQTMMMSICPQPQITGNVVCETPLQTFTSTDQVQHSMNGGFSTVYHHGLRSMSNNIADDQYSSDFYVTAPPTPQPTDAFPCATTTSSTDDHHHDNATTSPLTPPAYSPQQPLLDNARDYYTELMTMDPNSATAPRFQVTDYARNWVRDNILSYRYPPTTIFN